MTWHRHPPRFIKGGRRRGPPPFVRRVGCAFAALIVLSAIGASTLVSLFLRSPQRALPITAIGVAAIVLLVAAFAFSIRLVSFAFREQDRLRRQLMADVAHELRTPLAILQGRIEGLIDGVYPPDPARLGELLEETRHLSRLVEDLGTLANAEAGALDLRKELVDVAELIRDAAASLDAKIEVDAPDELPTIDIDPVRIREVLLNLLSNAVRHSPAGATVTIRAEAGARQIVIRVIDRGSGIAAEDLPRIFERFQKGRDSKGSGLGLAIARKFVLAHGGEIHVASELGRGTVVTVALPT
jgi:signal transduction histidine kinase